MVILDEGDIPSARLMDWKVSGAHTHDHDREKKEHFKRVKINTTAGREKCVKAGVFVCVCVCVCV